MTVEMLILSAIIMGAVILFALDIFPVDKVSALILSTLVIFRLVTPDEAIAGFGNAATVTVACMLALSYGIESTGGLHYLANKIVDLAGKSEFKILVSIVVAVGLLSAFINNTAAVALFLPLTIAVAREQRLDASKLLMPMSFAAIFAGTCTLIGTSTNLLVYSLALKHLDWRIGIFEFAYAGLIFSGAGILYLLLIGRRLIPSRRTGISLTEEYRLRHFVTELILGEDSPLIGKTIAEIEFREKHNVEVVEIIRGQKKLLPEAEETRLQAGDMLLTQGDPHTLMEFQRPYGALLKALTVEDWDLEDENIVLVEAFISPGSQLVESTLKEINFRRTFKANALAIRSHGRTIREKIGKIRLEYGDSLLILTSREQLEELRRSPDFLVLEEVRVSFLRKDKVYYAVGIFVGIIVLAVLDVLSIMEAAIIGHWRHGTDPLFPPQGTLQPSFLADPRDAGLFDPSGDGHGEHRTGRTDCRQVGGAASRLGSGCGSLWNISPDVAFDFHHFQQCHGRTYDPHRTLNFPAAAGRSETFCDGGHVCRLGQFHDTRRLSNQPLHLRPGRI